MKVKKLKFEQYRVRGKHREFDVLVFPKRQNMWAYYDNDDGVYSIDGDFAAYHLLKYALAVLIADPNKIIYLPIRDNNEQYRTDDAICKARHKKKQEFSALCSNTVFITLLKETCFQNFPDFLTIEPKQFCDCDSIWGFGYYFTSEWIRHLGKRAEEARRRDQEGKV